MTRSGIEPTTSRSRGERYTHEHIENMKYVYMYIINIYRTWYCRCFVVGLQQGDMFNIIFMPQLIILIYAVKHISIN